MSVLGYGQDEMLAVYLAKTYCLAILLYGCKIWHMSSSDIHKMDGAWENCFRKVFNACWHESVKSLQEYHSFTFFTRRSQEYDFLQQDSLY